MSSAEAGRRLLSRLHAGLLISIAALGLGSFAVLSLRVLLQRRRVTLSGLGSVSGLDALAPAPFEAGLFALVAALGLALVRRRPSLQAPVAALVVLSLLASALGLAASPQGHFVLITLAAAWAATLLLALPLPASAPERRGPLIAGAAGRPGTRDRQAAVVLYALATLVGCFFAMHRHWSYGSGSWDMGCMVHNFYRASRFQDTLSTVLGGADFLGDHFMVGIYLYAPLFWLDSSAYAVILVQTLNLAAAAPVAFLLARHHGASFGLAAALGLAAGFAFAVQAAVFFDAHEITVGIGFLALGLLYLERGQLGRASAALAVFCLFKESTGGYVVGLGLLLLYRGLREQRARSLRYGAAWIAGGLGWFVLVNRVFMPYFAARGISVGGHETFADFGPTVGAAFVGMLKAPLKVLLALFVPAAKLESWLVTLAGFGFLPLLAPEILLAALPLLAERFLSSKATMWEMGYHYAASLSLYAAWATALAAPRLEAGLRRLGDHWGRDGGALARVWAPGFLIAVMLLVNQAGYKHPAVYHKLGQSYFITGQKREDYAAGIGWLRAQGRGARIAAQNRLMPHLADRLEIHPIDKHAEVDFVLLALGDDAWPHDHGYPARLERQLLGSGAWRTAFSQGNVRVLERAR